MPEIIHRSELTSRELYFRVSATDLLMCSDLLVGNDTLSFQYQKKYDQGGDRIFCDMIDGGASWGVRLGPTQNPIIRLRPGRTIKKPFRYFTLYSTQPAPVFSSPSNTTNSVQGDSQETVIELYISTGDLIVDAPRDWGKGFGSRSVGITNCIASTTKRLILADFNNPGGFPNIPGITQWKPGRHGATLMLRNSSLGNTELFIAQASANTFGQLITEMFRIYPGESLTLDLDGSIQQSFNQQKMIGLPDIGLVIYTKAGTATYDWMLSRLDCDPAPASAFNHPGTGLNLG